MNFGALSRGFGTRCLRFKTGVATTPARLASGWLACLYREGVEPSGSLQKVSDRSLILLFWIYPGAREVSFFIVSPDSRGTGCPLSGRNSTYRPVQIYGTGSGVRCGLCHISICRRAFRARLLPYGRTGMLPSVERGTQSMKGSDLL